MKYLPYNYAIGNPFKTLKITFLAGEAISIKYLK